MTTPRMIAVIIAAALATPACYTLMKHPRIAGAGYQRPDSDKGCLSCHAADDLWSFTHPEKMAQLDGSWRYYYRYPWWFDRYLTVAAGIDTSHARALPPSDDTASQSHKGPP